MKELNNFPPLHSADSEGLLAIGGVLDAENVLYAYSKGIFPWYNKGEPIQWWSPDPRFVLYPELLRISKSMQKIIAKDIFEFKIDHSFPEVIRQCKITKRKGSAGTWITDEMESVYNQLYQMGHGVSAECWHEGKLVGGMYGIRVGQVFCGESMFSHKSNASKFVLIRLMEYLATRDIKLLDCQVYTSHLESLGAVMISRENYCSYLNIPGGI